MKINKNAGYPGLIQPLAVINKLIGMEMSISAATYRCMGDAVKNNNPVLNKILDGQLAKVDQMLNSFAGILTEDDISLVDANLFVAGISDNPGTSSVVELIKAHASILAVLQDEVLPLNYSETIRGFIQDAIFAHRDMETALQQSSPVGIFAQSRAANI